MQFNRFVFDNYLTTKEGKDALAFFNDFENIFKQKKEKLYSDFRHHIFIDKFEGGETYTDELYSITKKLFKFKTRTDLNFDDTLEDILNKAKKLIDEDINENLFYSERDLLLCPSAIESYSVVFFCLAPNIFFPYYFRWNLSQLEKIFHEFSIPFPLLPSKRKYRERFDYYFELCRAFYDFRKEHNLSPQEFCVFLYYFAPHIIEPPTFMDKLPEATKVYIEVCGSNDTELLNSYTNKSMDIWSGNENMQIGDIILMYETYPISAIRSIFRCVSNGFLDPFDYYVERVWIGKKQTIPPVSFNELKHNDIWKNNGYIKAKMQGVNGRSCSTEEYGAIKSILKSKGFDINILPKIQYTGLKNNIELKLEKDVEEFLLEPLLMKIGFKEGNWTRQLSVRMGRGERNYPDYALFPKGTKGEESAWFLWEAKLTIHNRKELLDAFLQAKSYALRLASVGFGLASREGVWLSFKKDSFLFDKIISFTWADLENADKFNKFLLLTKK